jgi:hypothetical protein
LKFDEAITDLLKVKPMPNAKEATAGEGATQGGPPKPEGK